MQALINKGYPIYSIAEETYTDLAGNEELNLYQISSDGQSIPFKETGIDPLCLDQIDPSVHSYINEIKDILLGQLKKDNPYDMSLDTLTLLGEMLLGIERHATIKERLGLT